MTQIRVSLGTVGALLVLALGACQSTPPPETREEMAVRAAAACPELVKGQYTYSKVECECVANRVTRLSWNSETSSYSGDPMVYEDALMIADTMTSAGTMSAAMTKIRENVSEETKTSIGSCFPSKY